MPFGQKLKKTNLIIKSKPKKKKYKLQTQNEEVS